MSSHLNNNPLLTLCLYKDGFLFLLSVQVRKTKYNMTVKCDKDATTCLVVPHLHHYGSQNVLSWAHMSQNGASII